ncbi:GTPase required for pre-60S ribosomal subunit nuclear export and maturation [Coelomomyces lativittatus]|nr:GTPase required for pre-60S ribosomal subunit nuclear export and maturation [Coelomomyces lativittatus]KAJ1501301.1 GTPase required for pre-60S ribosomal subunit nuclear export and maturation [Coelomomyces lativittatus]KAJ1505546.1 GTPase required for pre-60S ribosomal subunit nuclear export and maturation [Coelomomyces lativittatus]
MGRLKKEINRTVSSTGARTPAMTKLKGENFYRNKAKVRYLNMLKGGQPIRDRKGQIVKEALYQKKDIEPGRVEPNRKWFGNTRVIGQKQLALFREEMKTKATNPYQVLLHQSKLPLSLLQESSKTSQMHLLETESFSTTFGPKALRKKPKLKVEAFDQLSKVIENALDDYNPQKDSQLSETKELKIEDRPEMREAVFQKGQSKRIFGELYKVIDSSDVVVYVLDARDPLGTRSAKIEKYLQKECPHKHLLFVLNKCDLIPTRTTAQWVHYLSQSVPTLAFHASITNPFGKGALIQVLRQYARLHPEKRQLSVGFIGYPNTGKSSIINTLKKKKVCNVAPIPGETKIWQYITLMKRIYLIDCPGVVYPDHELSESEIVLKGIVRIENIKTPEDVVPELLARVQPEHLIKTYGIETWDHANDFLDQLAKKTGRLLKGGESDLSTTAKLVLHDWIRGRIPYYTKPPEL